MDLGPSYTLTMLGHFWGNIYFVVLVDAHSKWMEVEIVPSTATSNKGRKLRSIFATHGLPETMVSDNSPCFTSAEFTTFMTENAIHHIKAAPYHPSTNGLAEREQCTHSKMLKKGPTTDLEKELSRFLFNYRRTPHSTTGIPHLLNCCSKDNPDPC